jgi:enoyl-CoA hydratase/carnithine racemase
VTDLAPFTRTTLSRVGATAVLALASDKVNSLDVEVLRELARFVGVCEEDPGIGALVVTGEGPLFSAGLNVNEVLANDRHHTEVLLAALHDALMRIFTCPLPTVVAINGSAIAGGCILACAFDKRLIAEEARIGVTELRVGVSFPVVAVELLRHVCGSSAEQLVLDAELLDAGAACRHGLTHRLLPSAELQAAALAEAERLASLDAGAYALAKASSRRTACSNIEDAASRLLDRQVLVHWEDDQTRASLAKLLKPKD